MKNEKSSLRHWKEHTRQSISPLRHHNQLVTALNEVHESTLEKGSSTSRLKANKTTAPKQDSQLNKKELRSILPQLNMVLSNIGPVSTLNSQRMAKIHQLYARDSSKLNISTGDIKTIGKQSVKRRQM